MSKINIKSMSISFGITGVLFYIGCVLLMRTIGQESSIKFFNNILHGLDTSSIIKMTYSVSDTIIGAFQTFILWGLFGLCLSIIYNYLSLKNNV